MSNDIVEEIKSRCDIVDVIGRYVQLKRAGSIYKGLCPFHNEKTPSFTVYDSKQFFYCYGCGESGDVISFVMKIENIDFHAAVLKLAEAYGIDMDRFGFKKESKNNEIFEMNRDAARFFFDCMTKRANPGLDYMKRRGLDPASITKFGIGYADESWDSLVKHLSSKGYSYKLMKEAGIISHNQQKNRYYDKFRNRVIFPIFNTRNKVIGFGGRDLGSDGPKYLNSPESSVFSKKNNLYGLNITRKDIDNKRCAIMVEGYMDLVSLYRNGITNVAASLGTALTENQCRLLSRYADRVILAYDADSAGQKAALRGIEMIHKAGLKGSVLHITDGKDPDEFIKNHGREAFEKLLDTALPYADYLIETARKRHNTDDMQGRIDFLKDFAFIVGRLTPVEADAYIRKTAADMNISEGSIRRQIDESKAGRAAAVPQQRKNSRPAANERVNNGGNDRLQRTFIKIISVSPDYLHKIREYESVFVNDVYFRIYSGLKSVFQEDEEADIRKVSDYLAPEDNAVFQQILSSVIMADNVSLVFGECERTLRREKLQAKQLEILQAIDMLTDDQSEEVKNLSQILIKVNAELESLK